MSLETGPFTYEYIPGDIHYGRESIDDADQILAEHDVENALVVCGRHVSSNEPLMEAIRSGLGNRLADVFDKTTPAKQIETAYEGVEHMRAVGADALVPVGGGSSLDVASVIGVLAGEYRDVDTIRREIQETGRIRVPDTTPVTLSVPTTFAGADLSIVAGITVPIEGDRTETIVADEKLMPEALLYDPDLFETTPVDALAGSAINGFNKGIESIYSRYADPITTATSVDGLQYLRSSLPRVRGSDDPTVMNRAVTGIVLVQYGIANPDAYRVSVAHAFGHALRNQFGLQQGVAHAIMIPHVLRLLFSQVDAQRSTLAEALVADSPKKSMDEAIIEAVVDVRDGLSLPVRLRDVEGASKSELRDVAELARADDMMALGPAEFDPSVDEIERALRDAW